jgi:hypothetical protein
VVHGVWCSSVCPAHPRCISISPPPHTHTLLHRSARDPDVICAPDVVQANSILQPMHPDGLPLSRTMLLNQSLVLGSIRLLVETTSPRRCPACPCALDVDADVVLRLSS